MNKKITFLAVIMFAVAVNSFAKSYIVDFGPATGSAVLPSGTKPTLSGVTYASSTNGTTVTFVGNTNYSIKSTSGMSGTGVNGADITGGSASSVFPTATFSSIDNDYIYAGGTGLFEIMGLSQDSTYTIEMYASTTANANRRAKFTAVGATTVMVDPFLIGNNSTELWTVSTMLPDGANKISLSMVMGTGSTGNNVCFNCMRITSAIKVGVGPAISTTGTLSAVSTTYGTASSSPTTFSVSGANMSAGILVTPPAGYEVSLASGSGYAATVTVGAAGTISSTPVYVRLLATANVASSPYSGNITLTSSGATQVNVATVSSTVSAKGLTITGLTGANKPYDGGTTASFTGTAAYSGLENGDSPAIAGTPSAIFANANAADGKTITVSGYTAPTTNYTVTQPTLTGNISKVALTITAANQTVAYGTDVATVTGAGTYTPTGFVNSETSTVISGSVTYNTNYTNSTAAATSGITITPVVNGLSATNYSFTPANGSITITPADVSVSNPNISVSSLVLSPVSNITVNTNGSLVIDQSKQIASVTVNAGAKLSVATGQTLTLTNLTLKSDASGTSTFVNDGTLTLTGTAAVEQYLATTRNWYVSSPVSNALAPTGYTYYKRNEAGSSWTAVSVGAGLTAGIGYIALPGTTGLPITFTTQSGGTLNSGSVTIPITYTALATSAKGFNLIGNPYPAHLTWTTAFVDNNVSLIEPSIYYRTNAGGINSGVGAAWSFKTYNSKTNEFSPAGTTNIIPPMQAFWVRAKESGNLILNSDLIKSHQTSNPLKAPALNNSDRQRVRIQVTNGTRTDETVLLFDTNAADGYDVFDSPKFGEAGTEVQIYTTVGNEKLVINGMKNMPLNQEIALGFVAGSETSFSIKANEISNLPSDVRVILKDNVKMTETDLTDGVSIYKFGLETNSENRFSLIFRAPEASTDIDNVIKLQAHVFVNTANQITIIAPEKSNYMIYNTLGQKVNDGITITNKTIVNGINDSGVYLVRISENGRSKSTRIILNCK